MAAAAAIKLFLGFITQVVSKKASSEILEADAFHHYTDCLTTFIVAFGLIFVKKGYTYVDSVLGLIIAGLIIWWSFKMLREFADNLIGRAVSPEVYSQIQAIACSFNFVEGVHEIEVHSYGKNRVISLHIELNPKLSLEEAHSVADSIEKRVSSAGLGRCVVHVDLKPKCKVFEKAAVEKAIEDFLIKNDYVGTFHGIEIITAESSTVISFHLCLSKKTSLEESHLISHRLSEILKKKFSFSKINIHFEPKKT
jgi:divalent metal cation (Fe/Co/Zn/Cd) transporter